MWMRGSVGKPSFSPDGQMLLFGNGYYAQVWDANSGTPLTPPLNNVHASGFEAVFSPDQRRILAITVDRRLVSVDITGLEWSVDELTAGARLLSSRQMDATGAAVPLGQVIENGSVGARAVLQHDWERLHSRLGSQSEVEDAAARLQWHKEQALAAELSKDWYAAAFHLARICTVRPEDVSFRQRYVDARARLESVAALPAATSHFPARDGHTPARLIDLTPYYNFRLTDSLHGKKLDNSFSALPAGVTNLGGVDFDIRGLVHLASRRPGYVEFPNGITDIPIGLKASKLHFLHACSRDADKAEIANFVIHFANRIRAEIPIVYGRDVRDWHSNPDGSAVDETAAWTGTNADSVQNKTSIRLFKTTWVNPVPGASIETLDYISKLSASAPFLLAITAEE